MLSKLIGFVTLAFVVSGLQTVKFEHEHFNTGNHAQVFANWINHFEKAYESIEEETHRFAVFLSNWKTISESNDKNLGYTLGLNQFADLTSKEFRLHIHGHEGSCVQMSGVNKTPFVSSKLSLEELHKKYGVPTSVDWTAKGKVTAVKNQKQCGSCWAFSTTGSIESASAIAGKPLTPLSEQQLMDCSKSYGNNGCQGGLMDNAFRYVIANGGLCSESEYPYTAKNGNTCKKCATLYDPISKYTDVAQNEGSLEAAVAKQPVSIAIEADQTAFQFYTGGVLEGTCGTKLDHGVLIVGYGATGGKEYWKVKNSWGTTWGEEGYINICRNCNKNNGQGECGILDAASYPTAK